MEPIKQEAKISRAGEDVRIRTVDIELQIGAGRREDLQQSARSSSRTRAHSDVRLHTGNGDQQRHGKAGGAGGFVERRSAALPDGAECAPDERPRYVDLVRRPRERRCALEVVAAAEKPRDGSYPGERDTN